MRSATSDNAEDMVDIEVRLASPADVAAVLSVLDEAAAWLASRGIQQWPTRFDERWILRDVEAGQTWLAFSDGSPAATLALGWSDPLWPDDGLAGYVHRLARRRSMPGLGDALLSWTAEQILARGRDFIRLDCVADNTGLRTYYERRGFTHRGDAEVGGAPGVRTNQGHKTRLSLYERALTG